MKTSLVFNLDCCKYHKKAVLYLSLNAIFMLAICQSMYSQNNSIQDSVKVVNLENATGERHTHYLGTSVFILTSLIPNIDVFYYEIDYGSRINDKSELLIAALIQKSYAPMSLGFSGDTSSYPGHVVSGGLAFCYKRFLWENLFVMPMVNPLIVNYYNEAKKRITSGFMLMLCTRLGYQFDFNLFDKPLYFEVGGEINYWPINTNEPADFLKIENKFNKFVFAPSINIGFKF